ncbi:MAG: transglycosylase SLT domain-containing protein [Pseudobdellovibrio sp.]
MKTNSKLFIFSACFSLLFLFFINGCHSFFFTPSDAASFTYRGPLSVALREDLFSKSLEKDLMIAFAKAHSIQIKFVSFRTLNQAKTLLSLDKADLVFTRAPIKDADFEGHFSLVYDDLKLSVVCSGPFESAKELYIPTHYFYIAENEKFNSLFRGLHWTKTTLPDLTLKKQALKNNGFCYVTDTRLAKKTTLVTPSLKLVWTTKKAESVSWITRQDLKELNQLIHYWFQGLVRQNQIRKFWDPYENTQFNMTVIANKIFEKDLQNKLPEWRDLFEKYAQKNQIPWTLLAAVAYQESKWDNQARSFTGVRGLMQITTSTAEHLGIEDRTDPEQSIEGGAYYLKYLFKKTPKNLSTYERWAQTLAAYNIGWAHIRDARILAKNLNQDSNRWSKFKKILPLLSQEKYYQDLRFGTARGDETVDFVEQVFGYTEVLNSAFTRRSPTSLDF